MSYDYQGASIIDSVGNDATESSQLVPLHWKVVAGAVSAYLTYTLLMKPIRENPLTISSRRTFDREVVDLCNIMNELPGITTTESCSGHGDAPLRIYFKVQPGDRRGLFILLRSINPAYFKHGRQWQVFTVAEDVPRKPLPITFVLQSEVRGQEAYAQADALVDNIHGMLTLEPFIKEYELK
jgi:hypothetical protein